MGYKSITYFIDNMYSPIKEHVGNSEQNEVIGDSVFLAEKNNWVQIDRYRLITIKYRKDLKYLILGGLRPF